MKEEKVIALTEELKAETPVEAALSIVSEEKEEVNPDEVLANPKVYLSQYDKSVKWFYRRNLGTYPKSWLSPAKKILRFIFKFTPFRLEITARGRGKRRDLAKALNLYAGHFDQDLPIRYTNRVAVYVSIMRRKR